MDNLQQWKPARRLFLVAGLLCSFPVAALDLEFFDGEVAVTVNHALTYGVNVSVQKAADAVIYQGNPDSCAEGSPGNCGATAFQRFRSDGGDNSGPNDGRAHTNYNRGVYANQFKGTTDISATYGEFTAFTRLLYFYDTAFMDQDVEPAPNTGEVQSFTDSAQDELGYNVRTLDAYVAWETYLGDHPLTVRIGDQVINWGQSTFLPGIGLTNPVDLNRLFAPGFELRELFKPVGMAFASFGITENIAVEAYYQYDWQPVELPPGGSFFAANNYTGEGINDGGTGFVCLDGSPFVANDVSQFQTGPTTVGGIGPNTLAGAYCIVGDSTDYADDGNEFGLRLTVTLPWLNYTQLDFYAIRYHSRLPHVGATLAGIVPSAGRSICDALQNAGGSPGTPAATCENTDNPAQFPRANVMYEEDLWAYGFSWAGNLPGGWSFQGEVSLKKDFPVQASLPELIGVVAGMQGTWRPTGAAGPLGAITFDCSLRELDQAGTCNFADPGLLFPGLGAFLATNPALASPGLVGLPTGLQCGNGPGEVCDNFGAYEIGSPVTGDGMGRVPLDLLQTQFTLIKLFPQMFGGDTLTFVFEALYARVLEMPDSIQFETPDFSDFSSQSRADNDGWAYRLLLINEYSGLFGSGWNVKPIFVWFHDVEGSLPSNTGTFLEDRMQAIFVLDFQHTDYNVVFKYAWFGGANCCNVYQDRDSVSLTFKMAL